jgi:hypothetical protein
LTRAVLLLLACPAALFAQRFQPEARVDVIGPSPYALHGGVGVGARLGTYVRVSAGGAYGVRPVGAGARSEWRGDLLARALLDPFRQQRWGLSVGGGVTVRHRAYLAAIVDLEGPPTGGILPALQVGVGGGLRAGIIVRRAMQGRR